MTSTARGAGLVAAAVAVFLSGCTASGATAEPTTTSGTPRSTATSPAVTKPVPLRAPSARTAETQALSGDEVLVKLALGIPVGQRIDPALVSGLKAMRSIHVDETRFHQVDDVSAVVPVTTTDAAGKTTTWTATLILIDGTWRIGLTDPSGE